MSENGQAPGMVENTRWRVGMVKQAGKIMLYVVMLGVLSLLIAPVLMLENLFLRIALNLLVLAGIGLLVYVDGVSRGQKEVAHSIRLAKRLDSGTPLNPEESVACYHPMRGIYAALLAAVPFIAMGIVLAVNAKPSTYALQDLPSWLTPYRERGDIGGALAYYNNLPGPELLDYLRIVVRLAIMPFSNIVGGLSDQASLLLDRWSPLLVLLIPAAYAVGYLRGPAANAALVKRNAEAMRLHKKRVARKKKRERQGTAKKGPERLI